MPTILMFPHVDRMIIFVADVILIMLCCPEIWLSYHSISFNHMLFAYIQHDCSLFLLILTCCLNASFGQIPTSLLLFFCLFVVLCCFFMSFVLFYLCATKVLTIIVAKPLLITYTGGTLSWLTQVFPQ